MSFNKKNLSVIAYANGFTMWHYTSTDTIAAMIGADYFPETSLLKTGDMMIAQNKNDGKIAIRSVRIVDGVLLTALQ
ncbi:MAG: hypothetical protein LBB23_02355 [Rickettsiales bacterium]|jgi:hypothetical protein|nr:hypothetical protein [Rickettsiales bacterium]